jgi:hypothetical protein
MAQNIITQDFDSDVAKFSKKQRTAVYYLDTNRAKYLLYGGAMSGGKSYFLRWYGIRRLGQIYFQKQLTNVVGMLACEDYPALKDRQLQKISTEFADKFGTYYDDHKIYGRCYILNEQMGSGVLCFRNLDDPSKYMSSEWAFILVDELTKNEYNVFTDLRLRLRYPNLTDIECQFVGASNPGGVGHSWCKQLWIDKIYPAELAPFRTWFKYVQALATDNPYIDEGYLNALDSLPENLRKAYRDGDWNIFSGQAFPDFSTSTHVISPIPVPGNAPLYMTFDWGYGAPFSIGWWWVDNDGRVYRFMEWYGWNGTANHGIRLTDSELAEGIKTREERANIWGRSIIRLAGHDTFNKKPDYRGGGQGPSTAELFTAQGIYLSKADPNRPLKIRAFHERLRIRDDGKPMLFIYSSCEHFIRTVPTLVSDKNNIEEIDSTGEDHCFDDASQICMARPLSAKDEPRRLSPTERRIMILERPYGQNNFENFARESSRGYDIEGELYRYEERDDDTDEYYRSLVE